MAQHEFMFAEGKGTIIRACKFCPCSEVLIGTQSDMRWEPIQAADTKTYPSYLDCGETEEDEKHTTKPSAAQRRQAALGGKKYEPCYCDDCKGKKSHYVDSSDCYCRSCKGRKTHY